MSTTAPTPPAEDSDEMVNAYLKVRGMPEMPASKTPRTDAMLALVIEHDEGDAYDPQKMVPVTFARDLEQELYREQIRLAACGVVALADTPESAARARDMLPEYHSASCGDVERRVDECIRQRAERDELAAWKESAMTCFSAIKLQEVGRMLGVPFGRDIYSAIEPGIRALKNQLIHLEEARDALRTKLDTTRTALESITHDMGASQSIHNLCAITLNNTEP